MGRPLVRISVPESVCSADLPGVTSWITCPALVISIGCPETKGGSLGQGSTVWVVGKVTVRVVCGCVTVIERKSPMSIGLDVIADGYGG
jgi:hypothetical protein